MSYFQKKINSIITLTRISPRQFKTDRGIVHGSLYECPRNAECGIPIWKTWFKVLGSTVTIHGNRSNNW